MTADIAQFDILQIMPDALVGIEFRGIGGQLFQMDTCRTPLGQKVLDQLTAMGG